MVKLFRCTVGRGYEYLFRKITVDGSPAKDASDVARMLKYFAREDLVRKVILKMINRRLICGDAYYFQGDERDIIFMSMVAARNMRIGVLNRRTDRQRFNVAASRARKQVFLYHSVQLGDLNPECARYRLLQYYQNPSRFQQEIERVQDLFESQFEEDAYRMITARGYRVVPQVRVGSLGKRIDMVVEGVRNRLAVECDGDKWHGIDKWKEDMERQQLLESRVDFLESKRQFFLQGPKTGNGTAVGKTR